MFMLSANVHETRERGMCSKDLRLFTDNILVYWFLWPIEKIMYSNIKNSS